MTHRFKLSRRIARLRAPAVAAIILAFTACDTTNSLNPESSAPPESAHPAAAWMRPRSLRSLLPAGFR